MIETEMSPQPVDGCVCLDAGAPFNTFETRALGCDETDGRFGQATLDRCRRCGRIWLRYVVEYEAFSRSGRWARGLIREDDVETLTPETALGRLHGLAWYLYGGSYFNGASGRRSGPMPWGP
jgi:hypothetical protein